MAIETIGVEVLVPLDIEAGVVGFLRGLGYDASTKVPEERLPGMIRVNRVGGEPISGRVRDQPRLLIEEWGSDQEDSFDRVQRLFGIFEYMGRARLPEGYGVAKCVPSPPVQLGDPDASKLVRHQFTVEMLTQMGRLTV